MLPELIAGLLEDAEFAKVAQKAFKGVKYRGKDIVELLLKDSKGELSKDYIKKVGKKKLIDNLKKMAPADLTKLLEGIKGKQVKESDTVELLLNFDGQLGLSSSFLQYGIFQLNHNNKNEGNLTLAIDGKEYDFGTVRTSIWISMVQAKGKHGSGAGSVLWNTLWYKKRAKTLSTGGVAGTVKNLIKSRKSIYAQLARNQKYINQFQKVKKLFNTKTYYKLPTSAVEKSKNFFPKLPKL